jgi:hypothetical protein
VVRWHREFSDTTMLIVCCHATAQTFDRFSPRATNINWNGMQSTSYQTMLSPPINLERWQAAADASNQTCVATRTTETNAKHKRQGWFVPHRLRFPNPTPSPNQIHCPNPPSGGFRCGKWCLHKNRGKCNLTLSKSHMVELTSQNVTFV